MKRRSFIRSAGAGLAAGFLPGVLRSGEAAGLAGFAGAPQQAAFPKIVHHGMMVGRPVKQPEGTTNIVSYEIGAVLQLDRTHCLLLASMDEQGGPDLCVGNDAFVFEKISDIKAENAIPINRVETHYKLQTAEGYGFLAKYPLNGGIIPLGARLPDGRPHPAAGTGILVSDCLAFKSDLSDPVHQNGMASYNSWESMTEVIQVRWDGKKLHITDVQKAPSWLGPKPVDDPLGLFAISGAGFIAPFRFSDGHYHVVRFEWDGKVWAPTKLSPPFLQNEREGEPSIQIQGGKAFTAFRGFIGPKNKMYVSDDQQNYKFLFDWDAVQDAPMVLNQGLDGSLYLITNRNHGWFRNPLTAYPMLADGFGEGTIIHDQDGVRDDNGEKLPFVDHGRGNNVFLEGRWRHLLCYRVCDLKERTLYGFQQKVINHVYGPSGHPIPKRKTSGLYMAELLYDNVTVKPFFG